MMGGLMICICFERARVRMHMCTWLTPVLVAPPLCLARLRARREANVVPLPICSTPTPMPMPTITPAPAPAACGGCMVVVG
jgi:hypothetical protein